MTEKLEIVPARPRGRPSSGTALSGSERVKKHRLQNGLGALTVELPLELIEQFNEFLRFKDRTKNEVICSLLRDQLLRKR